MSCIWFGLVENHSSQIEEAPPPPFEQFPKENTSKCAEGGIQKSRNGSRNRNENWLVFLLTLAIVWICRIDLNCIDSEKTSTEHDQYEVMRARKEKSLEKAVKSC